MFWTPREKELNFDESLGELGDRKRFGCWDWRSRGEKGSRSSLRCCLSVRRVRCGVHCVPQHNYPLSSFNSCIIDASRVSSPSSCLVGGKYRGWRMNATRAHEDDDWS
eukprot:scaffold2952_cov312-Pinguiococcus_pyrenoidosus.AAC.10